jgi:hypothetical protein
MGDRATLSDKSVADHFKTPVEIHDLNPAAPSEINRLPYFAPQGLWNIYFIGTLNENR